MRSPGIERWRICVVLILAAALVLPLALGIFDESRPQEAQQEVSVSKTPDTVNSTEETESDTAPTVDGTDNRFPLKLLVIFVVGAAGGIGICYRAKKRLGIDNWTDDWT